MKILAVVVLLLAPSIARAQEEADLERARVLFDQGIAAGEEGHWEEAVEHFRASRQIADRPSTVYNLAVAYEELGRFDEASSTLEEYFRMAPENDSRRPRAEALRERLARRSRPPATRTPTPAPPRGADATPWALFGVGAALAAGGVVLAVVGQLDYGSVLGAPDAASWSEYSEAWDRAPILVGVGWAAAGVGVAFAVVGLVLATSGAGERVRAQLEVTPNGLALRGRF
jgi:tetratricopeptide (TPR) repeat protein